MDARPDTLSILAYFLERLTFINPDGLGIFLPGFFIFFMLPHLPTLIGARQPAGRGGAQERHKR